MHISSKQLSTKQEERIIRQLATLLADLKKTDEMELFLRDFLTPAELTVLAKRLAVLWSLQQGKSYETIKAEFNVSSATIATLAEQKNKTGLTKALAVLKLDDWADRVAQKLMQLPTWKK